MSTDNLEWRREKNPHCQHEEGEGEESATWAWVGLCFLIFVSGILGISAVRSVEEPNAGSVGALAPDEIVFLCREDGDVVAVTAAIHFGDKEISEPVLVSDGSVHCRGEFVDPRDVAKMGGIEEMLRFPLQKVDSEVAESAPYSGME